MPRSDARRLDPAPALALFASDARRLERLEDYRVTRSMLDAADFDLEGFLAIAVERLEKLTNADGVVVELLEGEEMVYRAASPSVRQHLNLRLPARGSLSGLCVQSRTMLTCVDAEADSRVDSAACRKVGVRSMLCAPLIHSAGAVGVVKLMAKSPAAFGREDQEALDLATGAIASALARQLAFDAQAIMLKALKEEVAARRALDASLQSKEERLEAIIGHAHQAIVTVDASGCITGWNAFAERLFGWPAGEVLGRDCLALLFAQAQRSEREADFQRLRQDPQRFRSEGRADWTVLTRGGESLIVETALSAFDGPEGWTSTFMMHDVTERRAETELFLSAFRHASVGMALVSPDGRFLKVNPSLIALLGYTEDELLALDFQSLTHPADLQSNLELVGRLLGGEIDSYRMEKRYFKKGGAVVWAQLSSSLVRGTDGKPHHTIAQIEDLTPRKAAEAALKESETRYRLIAENTSDMIAVSELSGRITFISAACRQILGREADAVVGRLSRELMDPSDFERVSSLFGSVAASGMTGRVRWRALHPARGEVWLESNPSVMRDLASGRPIGFLDVIRDVTDQTRQEAALTLARQEAEHALEVKTQFLANMSHEIRTPLTAVIGFSSLLAQREDLDEVAHLHVRRVTTASQALLGIVNDVLDFSKLEGGHVQIERRPVAAVELARDTLAMFTPQAEAKGLWLETEIKAPPPPFLSLDDGRMRQILLNLLGNAIKFTETGSVTLSLDYDADAERLCVGVFDTGPGLEPETVRRLFRRFNQGDVSTTRKHGGTGLGLAICKGLVEAMGGEISVTSEPGHGSRFVFTVPAPPTSGSAPLQGDLSSRHRPLTGVRLLVGDAPGPSRESLRLDLERAGAEVHLADDAGSVAAAALLQPVDVIALSLETLPREAAAAAGRVREGGGPNDDIPILAFGWDGTAPLKGPFDAVAPAGASRRELLARIADLAGAWTADASGEFDHA
jgi:PAS domain S-box-containing protein